MEREVNYGNLDCDQIIETIANLSNRIRDRFPEAGLGHVCDQCLQIAQKAKERAERSASPIISLRITNAILIVIILAGVIATALNLRFPRGEFNFIQFIQVLESGINDVVLIGAAIFFLVTLETRIKRARALKAIHELRSLAHIVDMHQLTKDPEHVLYHRPAAAHSPVRTMTAYELGRYLDYCSEMLSLIGKIAAVYIQDFNDSVVLASVNEVETLTTGLSRKIWQKLLILHVGVRGTVTGVDAPDEQTTNVDPSWDI